MNFHKIINSCLKHGHDMLVSNCLLCASRVDNGKSLVCQRCMTDLPWQTGSRCPQCGVAVATDRICGHCLQSPPAFDATISVFTYAYPLDAILQQYKYANRLIVAELFGKLLAEALSRAPLPDVVIPMPLHPHRLKERGFNQSVEMAKVMGRERKLAIDVNLCRRIRLSPPQASLPLKQRIKNMRNAFTCDGRLDGLKVALVDDVMTTGASLNALAEAVKKAGAATVQCWVLARTQPR